MTTAPTSRCDPAAEPDVMRARSRLAELEAKNRAHKPAVRTSLLLTWLAGSLRAPRGAAVEPRPEVAPGELGVTFAGHATLLLRYARIALACDPMLGTRLGVVPRAVRPGVTPADLEDLELVLLTSACPGRLHRPTLSRLPRAATVVTPPRCGALLSDLGFARVVELGLGHSFDHHGVEVTATPVRFRHARGACAYVVRGDGPTVFFCGESGYFAGFAEVGRQFAPEIAALPISGYVPRGERRDHLSPADAVYAFQDLGARVLLPIRHGAFPLSYETLAEPVRWLRALAEELGLADNVALIDAGSARTYRRG